MRRNVWILVLAVFGFGAAGFAQNAPSARLAANGAQNSQPARLAANATQNSQPAARANANAQQSAEQEVMAKLEPHEGDYVVHDFKFADGETMQDLRLHYTTLGEAKRDASGRVTNAVLVLHGTGGSGRGFLRPVFAGELFGPGQLLDAATHFIILPDDIGHGKSSKPSAAGRPGDGMRMKFPHYDYSDMVRGEYELVTEGLNVNHLRLVMGTSMGCMHTWMWGEAHPDFVDAMMPLACLPVEIAGRNRMTRKMIMDSVKADPAWDGGDYTTQPVNGLRAALDVELLMVSSPLQWQKQNPTAAQADAFLERSLEGMMRNDDANDLLYAFDSSRTYNPEPELGKITAYVMHVNSADDFVNPPELGIAQREIQKVAHGKFVLLPITDQTRGHGTHTLAAVWKGYLEELLKESER
ncbi:MAG TPA: alpha/beta fold hydrolase [Candidatus Acidoferrales bacterium]|nr:alpha/beta fold hydrolase [Candidatus Acidoferrales bacterium]